MRILLFFICLIIWHLQTIAMGNYQAMPRQDVQNYINQRDWLGFVRAMENFYVRPSDIAEYSKDTFDQPYMTEANSFNGKTLFQICLRWAYALRSDTHYNLLEALILGDKITHNANLANAAFYPEETKPCRSKVKITTLMRWAENPIKYYHDLITSINRDKAHIQNFIAKQQIQELAQYGRDRLLDVIYFASLSSDLKQGLIAHLSSQILLPNIQDEKKHYFTALRDNLQIPQPAPQIHHTSGTPQHSVKHPNKLIFCYKPLLVIASMYLSFKYYRHVKSQYHTQEHNILINQAQSELIMTDDEGLQATISSDHNSTAQLSKTTGFITLKLSGSDKKSDQHLRIDLSKYEDSFDDYSITIIVRKTRWYERLFIKTPLTYTVNWKQKPTTPETT